MERQKLNTSFGTTAIPINGDTHPQDLAPESSDPPNPLELNAADAPIAENNSQGSGFGPLLTHAGAAFIGASLVTGAFTTGTTKVPSDCSTFECQAMVPVAFGMMGGFLSAIGFLCFNKRS